MKPRKPVKRKRSGTRRGPWRSRAFRVWISQHFCCVCTGNHGPCTGERVSFAVSQAAHTKRNGMSSKGPDSSCVPLCLHHHLVYDQGRKSFEWFLETDLQALAAKYYAQWLSEGNTP